MILCIIFTSILILFKLANILYLNWDLIIYVSIGVFIFEKVWFYLCSREYKRIQDMIGE